MIDLSRLLFTDKSNITAIADRLEGAELIQRSPSPHDRRVTMLRLTAKGRHLHDEVFAAHQERICAIIGGDEAELRQVMHSLERIHRRFEQHLHPDPGASHDPRPILGRQLQALSAGERWRPTARATGEALAQLRWRAGDSCVGVTARCAGSARSLHAAHGAHSARRMAGVARPHPRPPPSGRGKQARIPATAHARQQACRCHARFLTERQIVEALVDAGAADTESAP